MRCQPGKAAMGRRLAQSRTPDDLRQAHPARAGGCERREGEGYVHLERPYGTFQRSFNLSVPVQADGVRADYKDGVLTVTLPKQEAVKPRKIQIQAAQDGNGGNRAGS